ncbi:hypothetical protein [Jiangella alba]|uniref:Uncharacterized protein n=1 Tax=Jiangella alba TaxID=561176 RepID=A0A1H5PVD2_9ACTN|nr:hypothetical protein [Jiangella alba]SEF17812.1 hypothetical protein SAMN04488561_6058 [Jiangella alba]
MRRVAVLLSALLVVACGDGDGGGSATPSGEPPGSPVTADLTVPPGTVLLGAPFPHAGGTEALLLVDGDPVAAFGDLVDQLRAAGLQPLTYHPDDDAEPATCRLRDDDPSTLECETHAFGPDGYRLDLNLLVSEDDDPYQSFVRVTEVTGSPSSPLPDLETEAPTPDGESPVTPPPVPDELPGPGDPIGAPFAPSGEEHTLLDGYCSPRPSRRRARPAGSSPSSGRPTASGPATPSQRGSSTWAWSPSPTFRPWTATSPPRSTASRRAGWC